MLRRFVTLCVLLVGLSGVLPAAVACAITTQRTDCCPEGQTCETDRAVTLLTTAGAPCCNAQPAPTRSTVAVQGQSDRRFVDSPVPDPAAAPAFDLPSSSTSLHAPTALAAAPPIKIDQQQIYLRTGRLRL
jgi:hypothetical protein